MKYLVFVIIMFSLSTAKSQLRILPGVGVSYGFFSLSPKNRSEIRPNNHFSDIFYSFKLEKKVNKSYYGLEVSVDDIRIGVKLPYDNSGFYGRSTGNYFYHYSTYYAKQVFKEIKLRKRPYGVINYLSDTPVLEHKNIYLTVFEIIPFIGLSINKMHETNWGNTETGYEELQHNQYDINFYYGANEEIISNYWGLSLNLGARVQFRNFGKDRLALHVIWNQGITKHIETHVLYKKKTTTTWQTSFLTHRGSYLALYASYPITLVNKKGERRKDRKLNKL